MCYTEFSIIWGDIIMHNHEIIELLKRKKNIVNYMEYVQIISSPQVDHVKFEDEQFYIWTKEGLKFELKIQR